MSNLNSVHLQDYPRITNFEEDKELIDSMDKVRAICSTALSIRDKHNIRVRLPLNKITVIGENLDNIKEFKDIILDEINVKGIEFEDNIKEKADFKLQLNFQKLGSFAGPKMPNILKALKSNEWSLVENKIKIADMELNEEYYSLNLVPKNQDNSAVVFGYNIVVELDMNITRDLELEGIVRDIVRAVQQSRKDANLYIADKIDLYLNTDDSDMIEAINKYSNYLKEQTLSDNLFVNKNEDNQFSFDLKVNGNDLKISFDKRK